MKKVCIFDFDGTIIDSMDGFADIASAVINKHYGTPIKKAREQYIKTSGLPFFEQLEVIFPGDSRNEVAADEYETTKKRSYLTKKPFKDVQKTMQNLKARGIKAIISSNNFQELVDNLVNRIGIKFDMVLGWRKNFSKGHDHFSHVRKRLGCKMDEMIFIGDSLKDAERAKDFGIDFVAKTGTFDHKDFKKLSAKTISSLSELEDILT